MYTKNTRWLTILFLLLLSCQLAPAQDIWQRMPGPNIGYVSQLIPDGDRIFARGYSDIFVNYGLGEAWVEYPLKPPPAKNFSLYVSGNTWYAFSYQDGYKLLRTNDLGQNWVTIFPTEQYPDNYTSAFYVSGDTCLLASRKKIYRSADQGNSWGLALDTIPESSYLDWYIFIKMPSGSLLFVGSSYSSSGTGSVRKSLDGGRSWQKTATTLGGQYIYAVGDTLYAVGRTDNKAELYWSANDGLSWKAPNHLGMPANYPHLLGQGKNLVLWGTLDCSAGIGVYRSSDSGENWVVDTNPIFGTSRLSLFAFWKNHLIFANSIGLWSSADLGKTFTPFNSGFSAAYCYQLLYAKNRWWASLNDGVLAVSADEGQSWQYNPGSTARLCKYDQLYATVQRLYLNDNNAGLSYSEDGANWSALDFSSGSKYAAGGTQLYVAFGQVLSRLKDGSNTLEEIPIDQLLTPNAPFEYIYQIAAQGDQLVLVLAGGAKGFSIFYSANSGQQWSDISTGICRSYGFQGTAFFHNKILFAKACGEWNRFNFDTQIWEPLFARFADGGAWIPDENFTFLLPYGSYLVGGIDGSGVFFSADTGATWTALDTQIPTLRVTAGAIHGRELWVGTYYGPIWRYTLPPLFEPDNPAPSLRILPNPVHETIRLEASAFFSENITLAITDGQGRRLQTVHLPAGKSWSLTVANLPAGFYVLDFSTHGFSCALKFIKL